MMVQSSFLQAVTVGLYRGAEIQPGMAKHADLPRRRVQGNPWCGAFLCRGAFPAGPVSWATAVALARLQPPARP